MACAIDRVGNQHHQQQPGLGKCGIEHRCQSLPLRSHLFMHLGHTTNLSVAGCLGVHDPTHGFMMCRSELAAMPDVFVGAVHVIPPQPPIRALHLSLHVSRPASPSRCLNVDLLNALQHPSNRPKHALSAESIASLVSARAYMFLSACSIDRRICAPPSAWYSIRQTARSLAPDSNRTYGRASYSYLTGFCGDIGSCNAEVAAHV